MKSFSLDIIANVLFSLKTNTYKDDDFSKKVSNLFSFKKLPLVMLSFVLPRFLCELFDLTVFNSKTLQYFSSLTLSLIEERKKNKDIVYNDFIEMLLKSKVDGEIEKNFEENGHIVKQLTTEEIVGQCLVFFLGN